MNQNFYYLLSIAVWVIFTYICIKTYNSQKIKNFLNRKVLKAKKNKQTIKAQLRFVKKRKKKNIFGNYKKIYVAIYVYQINGKNKKKEIVQKKKSAKEKITLYYKENYKKVYTEEELFDSFSNELFKIVILLIPLIFARLVFLI